MHPPVSGATDDLVTAGGGWLRRPKTGISSITALVIVPARTGLWPKAKTDGGAEIRTGTGSHKTSRVTLVKELSVATQWRLW